ncbi:formylglycine-generating enzyme family protein [Thermodesulfobacteriota bacterium]
MRMTTFHRLMLMCCLTTLVLSCAVPRRADEKAVERTESFTNSIGMKFVRIGPGSFMMGSPSDEPGRDSDETLHRVTLTKGFSMQTTEVTQGQWKAVMGSNPSKFQECGDDCPVENVSWEDCQEFISRLNEKEGTSMYRLPTEAEWEYACRAGSSTAFASGGIREQECAHDPNLDAMGWYCSNSGKKTLPVGQKEPNDWGLHDMHGNVWEWCQDRSEWKNGVATDTYKDGVVDPLCNTGSKRVNRGGSWKDHARYCRSAVRISYGPAHRYYILGFRVASD